MKAPFFFAGLVACFVAGSCQTDPVPRVKAGFSFAPAEGCTAPCVVSFSELSENTSIFHWDYHWDFGDSATSSDRNPSHRFETPGTYKIVLTLTGRYGADTASRELVVSFPPPVADFTIEGGGCEAPCEVTFTSTSTGRISSLLWSLEGGVTSTAEQVTHLYTEAGNYTVSLTATGPDGSSSVKPKQVTILPATD